MANALFDKARQKFLDGDLDWSSHTIKAVLVDTGAYSVDLANHDFLDDVASGARIATSSAFASKTSTAGVADADDITFTAVSSTNPTCEAIVIFRDTTVAGTSELIAYIDTATGLPITPNGSDITVHWSSGSNKIFKL